MMSHSLLLFISTLTLLRVCIGTAPKDNCLGSCYSYVADGYIIVRNDGGFVAKFELQGKLANHSRFCCNSNDFDKGQNELIAIPLGSTDLTLTVFEESFIDVWTKIFAKSYGVHDHGFNQCFEITGTTLEPEWKQMVCPGQSNNTYNIMTQKELVSNVAINNGNIGGEDGCAQCIDNSMCSSKNVCGQIGMRNHGGFVAQMCVYGSDNNGKQFCCATGNFDESKTLRYLNLPCNSSDVLVIGEEKIDAKQWSIGGADVIGNAQNVNKCYEISGTTLNNDWNTIICETSNYKPALRDLKEHNPEKRFPNSLCN